MSLPHEDGDLAQTTVRLPEKVRDDAKALLANLNRNRKSREKITLKSVIQGLVEEWVSRSGRKGSAENADEPPDRYEIEQVGSILAQSVASHLMDNPEWAKEAILKARLGLPAGSIFGDRIRHFHDEKEAIAKWFMAWLMKRVAYFLEAQKQTYLIIDSGTTLFWLFRELGPAIKEHLGDQPLENLKLVTNNIPGAQTYVEFGIKNNLGAGSGERPLSDIVECKLLSGTVLSRYAAVTGSETNLNLRRVRESARDAVFIGLVTGNWLTLNAGDRWPVPLAKGAGHADFKRTVMEESDEVYLVSPLSKIFVNQRVDQINKALGYEDGEEAYKEVSARKENASPLRLVSTSRRPGAILENHYMSVRAILGAHLDHDHATATRQRSSDLPHLFFPFDKPAVMAKQDQLIMEFPHQRTRSPEFVSRYFSVSSIDPQ